MKTLKFLMPILVFSFIVTGCNNDDESTPQPKSSANKIIGFVFNAADNGALNEDVIATIDEGAMTIAATVPNRTDVTALQPDIEISSQASIKPVGAQDFTSPTTYTVTAEDGTTASYEVTVAIAAANSPVLVAIEATDGASFSDRDRHESVIFNDKIWVLGGFTTDATNEVWNSDDGIIWNNKSAETCPPRPTFTKRFFHEAVVFDDKIWVIGGNGDNGFLNDVWVSENGASWKKVGGVGATQFTVRGEHTVTVFNDKLWVIGGVTTGAVKLQDVWSSGNGTDWTLETDEAEFGPRNFHQTINFDDKLWLIGGLDANENTHNDVWNSEDGKSWINVTPDAGFSERLGHRVMSFDTKLWVIGSATTNDVWYSEDGAIWTEVTPTPSYPVRNDFTSVFFDEKIWIIAGGNRNDVWYFDID